VSNTYRIGRVALAFAMMKRRAIQFVLALAVVIGVSVATGGVAAAAGVGEQSCRSEANRYTICILISHLGLNDFEIYVGVDVTMSQQYAQSVIDLPGDPFSATMYGEDPIWDDTLMGLRLTGMWAWSGGLSAEFYTVALKGMLNEDSGGGEQDEVFAKVWLFLPWPASSRSFRTTTINARF
jgi:hypothetical protein